MNSDRNQVIKAKAGDKKAMASLYKNNFKSLYIFVRHKVDTNERAEDIVAETFIRAFEKLDTFNIESSFKTWIYTIAKNLVIDWYKSKIVGNQMTIDDEQLDQIGDSEEESTNSNKLEKTVKSIFKNLNSRYKEILEMRFLLNMNINECAENLGITKSNVKVLQNRAIKQARDIAIKNNIV